MSTMRSGIEAAGGGGLAGPLIEGKGIKRVRLGSEGREAPQGVFGLDAISQQTVHSSLHAHTNCETTVYITGSAIVTLTMVTAAFSPA